MWVYKVIRPFIDSQDDNYRYNQGDIYPRNGFVVEKERINELKGDKNKSGLVLIKAERRKKEE